LSKLLREISGVVRADALFGTPDIVALVEGDDVAAMDAVIDRIVEIDGVVDTESKVVRWVPCIQNASRTPCETSGLTGRSTGRLQGSHRLHQGHRSRSCTTTAIRLIDQSG
jgi:hypothetical protein